MTTGLHAIVVTGSREWHDRAVMFIVLSTALRDAEDRGLEGRLLVIHGGATGADAMAHAWAETNGLPVPMRAQWDEHGNAAGPIRNNRMATVARCLQACGWDVRCHAFGLRQSQGGTKNCVQALKAMGLEVTKHETQQKRANA